MFKKRLIFISLFTLTLMILNAQTVSDYFHKAANFYIKSEKANAKKTIEEAIQKFPNDPKVKQLANAINKLPEDPPKDNKNNKQQPDKPKDQKQDQQKQQQPQQQPQMSKENAQQILDALQQDEKNTQDKAKKQPVRGKKKADKDW